MKQLNFHLWYNIAMNSKNDQYDFNPFGDKPIESPEDFELDLRTKDDIAFGNIEMYVELMLEYNQKVNVISRKITANSLNQLLNESLGLNKYVNGDTIIDAGSGNGILGIPLSVLQMNEDKTFVLVEPKPKKADFLEMVKEELGLENIEVACASIEEYLKRRPKLKRTVIARGFPNLEVFCGFLKKGLANEAVLITSENKIKKNQIQLESVAKRIYNIPLRTELKILKLRPTEKIARGRKDEKNM